MGLTRKLLGSSINWALLEYHGFANGKLIGQNKKYAINLSGTYLGILIKREKCLGV